MWKHPAVRCGLILTWLIAAGGGFTVLAKYQNAGGTSGSIAADWPAQSTVTLDHDRPTLLMFAHPHCPCTRASIEELNRLLARTPGHVAAQVWFFKPAGFSVDWTHSDIWRSAAAIPGVTVHQDGDGALARAFGAETSGMVLVYDPEGKLRFKGGITGSRGHCGDNAGEDAIVSFLDTGSAILSQTPVYGCSLLGECHVVTK